MGRLGRGHFDPCGDVVRQVGNCGVDGSKDVWRIAVKRSVMGSIVVAILGCSGDLPALWRGTRAGSNGLVKPDDYIAGWDGDGKRNSRPRGEVAAVSESLSQRS